MHFFTFKLSRGPDRTSLRAGSGPRAVCLTPISSQVYSTAYRPYSHVCDAVSWGNV